MVVFTSVAAKKNCELVATEIPSWISGYYGPNQSRPDPCLSAWKQRIMSHFIGWMDGWMISTPQNLFSLYGFGIKRTKKARA